MRVYVGGVDVTDQVDFREAHMPKDKGDIEMTRGQARAAVAQHETKHGREMELTPEAEAKGFGREDIPTDEEVSAQPAWAKNGGKRPPHPDD